MKKKNLLIFLILIVMLILGLLSYKIFHKEKTLNTKDLINISELSEDFMQNYLKETTKINSGNNQENVLIVISKNKIKNNYGAINVVEAPNNQYLLEYKTTDEKNYALEKLQDDKSILNVEENKEYTIDNIPYNSWGIESMGLDYANEVMASNDNLNDVVVAVIDAGFDIALFNKHYNGKLSEIYNAADDIGENVGGFAGHGTHIIGTIAEATPSNVNILPIKVANEEGKIFNTATIQALNYVTYYNKAEVISMSLGSYSYSESYNIAIQAANKKNITVVTSAGNNNTSAMHYPSSYDGVISIAAVDSSLEKASFSNYGSKITFTAPGVAIKSLCTDDLVCDGDYILMSGTSMAAPHGASAVAILKSYNKNLSSDEVVDLLNKNAVDLGDEGWDPYYGYGLISFKNAKFCDGNNCDKFNVFKNEDNENVKEYEKMELDEVKITPYNYGSITNILGTKIKVFYKDGSSEFKNLADLDNATITGYNPNSSVLQNVTVGYKNDELELQLTNPLNFESGFEYNIVDEENKKIKLSGYKSHLMDIKKLYIPEEIDGYKVIGFADFSADNDFFNDSVDAKNYYEYLYLPSSFNSFGAYSMSKGYNFKYVYGDCDYVDVGDYALSNNKFMIFNVAVSSLGESSFENSKNLKKIKLGKSIKNIPSKAFKSSNKLETVDFDPYANIDTVGESAFANCYNLKNFNFEKVKERIEKNAFYHVNNLIYVKFSDTIESIGEYAFYHTNIKEIEIPKDVKIVEKGTFEYCMNLETVDLKNVEVISENAFGQTNIKNIEIPEKVKEISSGAFNNVPFETIEVSPDNKVYKSSSSNSIIEIESNILIKGSSKTKIPSTVKEIGRAAFVGNVLLEEITIPNNVEKIGNSAFCWCYNLKKVIMPENDVVIGLFAFKDDDDLTLYVHKNSTSLQYAKDKKIKYRQIEPDNVVVSNINGKDFKYKVFDTIDVMDLLITLTYNEDTVREEIISDEISSIKVIYQNSESDHFDIDDTYFTVVTYNENNYKIVEKVPVEISKLVPEYSIPKGLTAEVGQKLSEISLPNGFVWANGNEVIKNSGNVKYIAKYIPTDTKNYEIVDNIEIELAVTNNKQIITPNIKISDKLYDGSTIIPSSSIEISNLNSSDYSIISASTTIPNVGDRDARVTIKLTDEKYKDYSFSDGSQEKEFTVLVKIIPNKVKNNTSDYEIFYDGEEHNLNMDVDINNYNIKYSINNTDYDLNELPKFTEVGEHIVNYKITANGYDDLIGSNKVKIYGIKKIEESIKLSNNILIVKDNKFENIKNKIVTYSNSVLYNHYDKNKELTTSNTTKTGDIIKITLNNSKDFEYDVSVLGDINGDGLVNSADLLKARQHLIGTNELNGLYYKAADIDYNDEVNSADLLRIRQHLLGTKTIS